MSEEQFNMKENTAIGAGTSEEGRLWVKRTSFSDPAATDEGVDEQIDALQQQDDALSQQEELKEKLRSLNEGQKSEGPQGG
jgi:hypothetical protein